ncbi:MAG: hypothetical protein ACK4YP_04710 [Myxococcota bacterium]
MMWFLLLAACPTPDDACDEADKACDTGDTAPDDTDTDADPDTLPDDPADTGVAEGFYVGSFETEAGAYAHASFGLGYYGLAVGDWVCRVEGTLPYEGPAPDGCPDCDWAFDLGPVVDAVATGAECGDLGVTAEGLEGAFDYAWGFAEVYAYDYNGTPLDLEKTLFINHEGEWFPIAWDYAGSAWTHGDAESLEVVRPILSGDSSYTYYYYYR